MNDLNTFRNAGANAESNGSRRRKQLYKKSPGIFCRARIQPLFEMANDQSIDNGCM